MVYRIIYDPPRIINDDDPSYDPSDPRISFLEFEFGIEFTKTTLTFQPITSIRSVLTDGTEVDGAEYLDYYNEQITVYTENVTIHYTVNDESMTWDIEIFTTSVRRRYSSKQEV